MPVRWIDPIGTEASLLAEVEARFTRMETTRRQMQADPALGQRLAAHASLYGPYAKPGVIVGMAKAGVEPDSEVARTIAARSGAVSAQQTGGVDYGETVNGSVMSKLWGAAKATIRTGFMALSAPFEEASALVSAAGESLFDDDPGMGDFWSNYTDKAARSSLGLAIGEVAGNLSEDGAQWSDFDVDAGDGIFVGGQIAARREADKNRLQLDGEFVTPGRLLARAVTEPGTKPYNFVSGLADFAANVFLDPTTWVTGGVSKANAAAKTFGTAVEDLPAAARAMAKLGLVKGAREGVIGETVVDFLGRTEGGAVKEALAGIASPSQIWHGFGGKIDRTDAVRLADAATPGEVEEVLLDLLGHKVAAKPTADQFDVPWHQRSTELPVGRRTLHGVRMLQEMPKQVIDLNDGRGAINTLDAYLRNVKIPDVEVREFLDEAMRLPQYDAEGWNGIVTRANERIVAEVVAHGKDDATARALVKPMAGKWAEFAQDARMYLVDRMGNDILPPWARDHDLIDGTPIPREGGVAALLTHARGDFIVLPDVRELRRATSWMGKFYDTPVIGGMSKTAIDLLSEHVVPAWKKLAILRPALGARVVADEQARIAAHGDASLFSHPFQAIAWAMGRKGAVDPSGNIISDVARQSGAMSTKLREVVGDRPSIPGYVGDYVRGRKNEAAAPEWFFSYLQRFATDEISQEVAGRSGRTIEEIRDAMMDGDLRHLREELIRNLRADRQSGRIPGGLDNPAGVEDYLRNTVQKALWDGTGGDHASGVAGNPELMASIAQGRVLDFNPLDGAMSPEDMRALRTETVDRLRRDHYESMPPILPRPRIGQADPQYKERLDKATNWLFATFLSNPSDKYSRSVEYKQALWREYDRLIPYMTAEVQQQVIAGARDANLGDLAARMTKRAGRGAEGKIDHLADLEKLGHAVALDDTRKLLYDLANRSQFSDIMRIMIPFAEPWKEVMTTWGRLAKDNPGVLRRGQQIVQGARTADPDGDGKGFFYTENGVEQFAYPGGHLVGKLLGLPGQVDLTARAGGLNMVTSSFLPGFGPVVQIPAGMLIPDRPKWDGLRDIVLPYGTPGEGEGSSPGGVLDSLLPAYMKRAITALNADPVGDRVFANTVTDVMRLLASSGDYDNEMGMIDPASAQRLLADAKGKARSLYWVRALAQSTLPTGPTPAFSVDTPEGVVQLQALADEYRKMQADTEAGGFDTALDRFVERFGYDVALALTPKSKEIRHRSTTTLGLNWEREHADLIEKYSNVAGYFAPDDPDGEFDYTAYLRQLRTGDREAIKPDEVIQLHNNTLGRLAYEHAQQQMGPMADTPEGQAALARIRVNLRDNYPGFQTTVGIPGGADTDTLIAEFRRAIEDPLLRNTEIARATSEWLMLRDQATAAAQQIDSSASGFTRAASAAPVRQWLREEAAALTGRYPTWAPVYDRVFSRELDLVETETQTGVAA